MSAEASNPAATPTPCEDSQGDGRWMSQVCDNVTIVRIELLVYFDYMHIK